MWKTAEKCMIAWVLSYEKVLLDSIGNKMILFQLIKKVKSLRISDTNWDRTCFWLCWEVLQNGLKIDAFLNINFSESWGKITANEIMVKMQLIMNK